MREIIVAITGASGAILGVRLLEELEEMQVRTHLIISKWAQQTIQCETRYSVEQVRKMASVCYDVDDLAASVSSGSFKNDGMAIVPCSMKTLAYIANGLSDNLISRAADVTIKEKRKLILVPRETPLSSIHLKNLLTVSDLGASIIPPSMGFYFKPQTINDCIDYIVGKILDSLNLENNLFQRWK